MNTKNYAGLIGAVLLLALLAGCTPQARDDVSNAGSDLNAAATDSAKGTKQAIDKADEKAKADTQAAVATTEQKVAKADAAVANGASKAVQGTEKAVANAGATLSKDTSDAVQGTERAAAKAGDATKDTTAILTLTPKVKSAILVDDRVKIPDLNIDTKPATMEVIVNGTVPTAEMKSSALSDAKRELQKANPRYKLVDNITVAK